MAEPPHHDHTRASDARHTCRPARRIHRRLALIILVKLALIALLVALPAQLAISFGAAHAVVLLLVAAVAGALLLSRRRGRRTGTRAGNRPPHGH